MILKHWPIPNYRVVPSIPFSFTAPLSILLLIPRISRLPLTSWLSIFKVNKSTVAKSMISMTSMAWKMPFGILYLWSMWLNRTLYILIRKQILLGPKFLRNLPQELLHLTVIPRRILPSLPLSPSIKRHPSPLFWPKLRRRSILFPNIFIPRNPRSKTMLGPPKVNSVNLMRKHPSLQQAHLKS